MRSLRKPILYIAAASFMITQSGCFGSFELTKKLYGWNDGVSSQKFVKTLVFWGLNIIPVYGAVVFLDAVIFNLIEFWSGSNPIAMNEGDSEVQDLAYDGNTYRVVATKDTFTTTQLTGADAGAVRVMSFDRTTLTWNYTDAKVTNQPVMSFLDDHADRVRVYTTNGHTDLASADLQSPALVASTLMLQATEDEHANAQ